jgi:hypothetical protein
VKGFDVIYSVDAIRNLLSIGDLYDAYDGSPELKHFVPKGIWFGLYEEDELAGSLKYVILAYCPDSVKTVQRSGEG